MRPAILTLLLAGCGDSPERCAVVGATVDPALFVLDDDDVFVALAADTTRCDPGSDHIQVAAVIEETSSFHIADLDDDGQDMDSVAADGLYERTIFNPFYGGVVTGAGVLRFEPCDPDCHGPAVEVAIQVDAPAGGP